MRCSTAIIVLCIVAASVQARLVLDEAAQKCVLESKISDDTLEIFLAGSQLLPVDNPELEAFFECRFGKHHGSDTKMIFTENLYDDVTYYIEMFTKNHKLAATLARVITNHCGPLATGDTKGKVIVNTANCFIEELKGYGLY